MHVEKSEFGHFFQYWREYNKNFFVSSNNIFSILQKLFFIFRDAVNRSGNIDSLPGLLTQKLTKVLKWQSQNIPPQIWIWISEKRWYAFLFWLRVEGLGMVFSDLKIDNFESLWFNSGDEEASLLFINTW